MRILGRNYVLDGSQEAQTLDALGKFNERKQTIQVASDQLEQGKISTVLHEIIEALNFHLELRLDHNAITCLESGLFQVLTDNGVDLAPLVEEIA